MVGVLSHEEAWDLFQRHAGDVAVRPEIRAEDVEKECAGLPLALIIVGASMKGKFNVQLWKHALTTLRMPDPDLSEIDIEEKVFKTLKWSYDLLPDKITQSCFLFCCLYPEDYNIIERNLVRYWYCEGLFNQRLNYDQGKNQSSKIIQCLRDCCLLEKGQVDNSIKVHDVVRDVGIWIASSNGHEYRSLVRSGIQLTGVTKEEFSHSYKRVSFMDNRIRNLPDGVVQCPEASTLLLQGNRTLEIIPISFLKGFESLKILDLSGSMIESLPSLDGLNQLRALILNGCELLKELPALDGLSGLLVLILHGCLDLKELPALDGLSGLLVLDCGGVGITQVPYVGISRLHKLGVLESES